MIFGRIALFLLVSLAAGFPSHKSGMQQLICRGKPGIDLRVTTNPSPDNPRLVRMTLRYAVSPAVGEYTKLQPGTCSWNLLGSSSAPKEPGVVTFDVSPEAQPWFATYKRQMDTTVDAAGFFPDTISLPRYLGRTERYWTFFVDDQTNHSISFGAYKNPHDLPTYVTIEGSFATQPTLAELRCRGGGDKTLFFGRSETRSDNKTVMWLSYRLAGREAGENAEGLTPGTCAWVKRNGLDREPGRIDFITASNAQLVQARSGGTVDKSPTAAERFPDANTIPLYMQDPLHYWNFHVSSDQLTSARAHAAWMRGYIPGERSASRPMARQGPTPESVGNRSRTDETGQTLALADPGLVFHEVVRKPTEYWLRFSARANSSPVVTYSTQPPVRSGGSLVLRNAQRMMVRQGTEKNFAADYSTAPLRGLPMNTKYYFVINVPAGSSGQKAREYSGEFTTFASYVTVHITRIDVLNDSDKNSDGDLAFRFFFTPAPNTRVQCSGSDTCEYKIDHASWGTGSRNPVDITLSMTTGASAVRVWVNGADDDNETGYAPRARDVAYGSSGWSASFSDGNTASGEFKIDYFPDRPTIRLPMKLRSVDGSVFMFEVVGEIEVNRR